MEMMIYAYWLCLVIGIGYTIISFVFGEIAGAGHVGDAGGNAGDFSHSYGVGGDGGYGGASGVDPGDGAVVFGPFSPLVIAFFLTSFGAVGILLSRFTLLGLLTIPIAVVSALVLAWMIIIFFNRLLGNLQGSSEIRMHTLVGSPAEVTVAIPASGIGEVAFVAMGSRNVSPARSEDQVDIPRFSAVEITRVVGNLIYVRPQVEEELRSLDATDEPTTSVPAE